MLVSSWILLATAAVVVSIVMFLAVVTRRALNELYFWRGAYCCTSELACELLEEAERGVSSRHLRRGIAVVEGRSPSPLNAPFLPSQRYAAAVDTIRRDAAEQKIDWVSEDDRDHYRAQHASTAEETDLSIRLLPSSAGLPRRAERARGGA